MGVAGAVKERLDSLTELIDLRWLVALVGPDREVSPTVGAIAHEFYTK